MSLDIHLEGGLPAAPDAERAILGSVLLDNKLLEEAMSHISPSDFSTDANRRTYSAMLKLGADRKPIDLVTLGNILSASKELDVVGGMAKLSVLTEGVPLRPSVKHYCAIVREKSRLRSVIQACTAAIKQAATQDDSAQEVADSLLAEIKRTPSIRSTSENKNFFVGALSMASMVPDEIEWAVKGVIPRGWNGFIIADPKSLKSYSTTYLMMCLALGVPWLGFDIPRRMRTALLAREDYWGLTAWRVKKFIQGMIREGVSPQKLDELDDWMFINTRAQESTFSLQDDAQLNELISRLKERQVEFLAMDVFRKLHSSEENDNTEMQAVLERVNRIQAEVGCAIGIVHHARSGEGSSIFHRTRGATVIHGWMEWGLGLTTVNPDDPPKDRVRKMEFLTKAGCEPDPIYIKSEGGEDAGFIKLVKVDCPERKKGKLLTADDVLGRRK